MIVSVPTVLIRPARSKHCLSHFFIFASVCKRHISCADFWEITDWSAVCATALKHTKIEPTGTFSKSLIVSFLLKKLAKVVNVLCELCKYCSLVYMDNFEVDLL